MKIATPILKKVTSLFPSNPPLKVEVLSSLLFETLIGGSTTLCRKGGCTLWVCMSVCVYVDVYVYVYVYVYIYIYIYIHTDIYIYNIYIIYIKCVYIYIYIYIVTIFWLSQSLSSYLVKLKMVKI